MRTETTSHMYMWKQHFVTKDLVVLEMMPFMNISDERRTTACSLLSSLKHFDKGGFKAGFLSSSFSSSLFSYFFY